MANVNSKISPLSIDDNNSSIELSDYEEATKSREQTEDVYYLGAGGHSMWSGEGSPGCWVRKMGNTERFMTRSADFNLMSTVYGLWFESKIEIDFDVIRRTCYVVAKKLPHLRLAVGNRNGELWFKQMKKLDVDVKMIKSRDIMHDFQALLTKKYDLENGPLWFVRYMEISRSNDISPVVNRQAKSRFVCVFGFFHNFTDGTSNIKFCNVFLKVLNNEILHRPSDMRVEAKFVEPFHDRIADEMISESLIRSTFWLWKYQCQRFYAGILSRGSSVSNYTNHHRQPAQNNASTRIITGEIDAITTARLLTRCRKEKTTLNSVFTAAANLALYKIVLKSEPTLDLTHFGGIQTINMRRYWPKEHVKDSCGCHISTLDIQIPTARKDLDNFWNYARHVQDLIENELNVTKRVVKLTTIAEHLRTFLYANYINEWAGYPSNNDNHYCITNMGDLSKSFKGTGEVIDVTRLIRSVSCHYMPNLCQHTLHTFRGKLCYSLDYYTQKMQAENAELYYTTIFTTLLRNADPEE